MIKKSFFIKVLGCQQNEHDGARIRYLLYKLGLVETKPENAELIVIVACSVRQTAVDRIFGNVRNWTQNRSSLPTVIATGCVLDSDRKKFAQKGIMFWNINKPEDIAKLYQINPACAEASAGRDRQKDITTFLKDGAMFSSSVPIMFGCNNFCTYCATAFTRGRERSREMGEIISDVKSLISKGTKEILLLGQTIDSYKDPETSARLDVLFKKLNDLDGDFIISFTSNHPKDMTNEIVEAVATLPKIKKEIHLPVQSGSDKILKLMKRPYTTEQYLKLIENCKLKIKDLSVTTDVIVGFPGETERDFLETVKLFKKVKFSKAYVNKYSPRPGTAAYKLGDPILWKEKQRRWQILDGLANKKI